MKRCQTSSAKIARPFFETVLPRERLFSRLDQGRSRPLIWISGPAGSGKTTLISSYVEARNLPCLWYRLDEGDGDIASFFYYLGLAERGLSKGKHPPLPLFTPEYLLGVPQFTFRFFEQLFSHMKEPSTVVLDNFQIVAEGSPLERVVINGLTRTPQGLNAVIISRSRPSSSFAVFRARGQMEIIGWDQVRLTPEEFTGVARLREDVEGAEEVAGKYYPALDGWVAGLILMLERAKLEGPDTDPAGDSIPESVFDYLATEILERISPAMREFLFKTAFLTRVSPLTGEDLAGNPDAERYLAYLHRHNLFTERVGHSPLLYQYHPLFREFLLSKARERMTAEEVSRVLVKAAGLLSDEENYEDASTLLAEAKEWEELANLILERAGELMAQGRHGTIQDWISHLPEENMESAPWLGYWAGMSLLPPLTGKARERLIRAYRSFRSAGDAAGAFLSWAGIVETVITEFSDFKPLDEWIDEFEELVGQFGEFPSAEIETRAVSQMFNALLFRQPDHPKVGHYLMRVEELFASSENAAQRMMLGHNLFICYLWRGDWHQTRIIMDQLGSREALREASPLYRIWLHLNEAVRAWASLSIDESLEAVQKGVREGRRTGIRIFEDLILTQGVHASLCVGRLDTAREYLDQVGAHLTGMGPYNQSHYYCVAAWEALEKGDLSGAHRLARKALDMSIEAGSPFPIAQCYMALARIVMERGDQEEAGGYLSEAGRIGQRMKSVLIQWQCQLHEAYLALLSGDEEKAVAIIREAFSLGKEWGMVSFIYLQRPLMTSICAEALQHEIEVDYVQSLVRKHRLIPEGPLRDLENWPWPLRMYTLGRFSLIREGVPVRFSGRLRAKPLELLKALVALGGRKVCEEELWEALWPEADGDVAHQSFATNLHRLRKLIGVPEALVLSGGKLTLDRRYCWVDVWAAERLLGRAEEAWKGSGNGGEAAARLSEKAMDRFRSDFLPEDSGRAWSFSIRERLRSKYFRTADKLGRYREQSGQWEKAVECYRRALEMDPLAEDFYRRLMACYCSQGRRAEALAAYQRCREILARNLDVVPSPETELLYREIRSDEKPV